MQTRASPVVCNLMSRTPVLTRVAEILESSGRTDSEVIIGFTHRALAARVYNTRHPTTAQLSAVRRAVAQLVADGRATRSKRVSAWEGVSWRVDLPPRYHERDGEIAANPGGIVIDRTPTDEDRDARQAWLKAKGDGDLAEQRE